jgi:RHS repeat-associated protein
MQWAYQYDNVNGRMTAVVSSNDDGLASGSNQATFDDAGRMTKLALRNGSEGTYQYDQGARLTKMAHQHPTPANATFEYLYDANSNITQINQTLPGTATAQTMTYQYDDLNRLTKEDSAATGTANDYTDTYTYDAAGNRTQMIHVANAGTPQTKVYAYNDGNQLTKVDITIGASIPNQRQYFYDPAGRLTSQHQIIMFATPTTKAFYYQWDALDRMTKAQIVTVVGLSGTKTLQYDYNSQNQRVRRIDTETAATKLYSYEGNSLASIQTSPYTPNLDRIYTNTGGRLCNIIERNDPWYGEETNSRYYQYNHRGDVVAVTDSLGGIWYGYDYDAFGNITFDYNTFGGSAPTDDLLMTGKDKDPDLAFYYFGARWCDPEIGRWISREPTGLDGINLYVFCWNNPVNSLDNDGKFVWFITIGVGAVIGGAVGGVISKINGGGFWSGAGKGAVAGAIAGSGAAIGAAAAGAIFGAEATGAIIGGSMIGGGVGGGAAGAITGGGPWGILLGALGGALGGLGGEIGAEIGGVAGGLFGGAIAGILSDCGTSVGKSLEDHL